MAQANAAAQTSSAVITTPANGSVNADFFQPIQWTTVPDAQTYYLYVGTTIGAHDLINTGEIQRTTYAATTLPANQIVYARLWTKVAGAWRYTDSSFSGDVLTSRIVSPANGATSADWAQPIQWTPVPHVQKYYLYVGTTVGAKDLINTGEIVQTSVSALTLPANRVVYARLWIKVAGVWRYTDSSFSGDVLTSRIVTPANGTTVNDWVRPIDWTVVPNAQTYYLYLGTTVGARDLGNSGETTKTSFPATGLPTNTLVWARLWTKVAGVWRYVDSSFSGALLTSTLTYPVNGASNVDLTQPIRWTALSYAQAYYLYVGSTVGTKDLLDTGEIHQASVNAFNLPPDRVVYARLWTKVANGWRFSDSTFSAQPLKSVLVFPPNGATNVVMSQALRWTPVTNADVYYLYVGSTPGAKDLVNTGETRSTSFPAPNLPIGQRLYARIWTKMAGVWRYSDSTFGLVPVAPLLQHDDLQYEGSFRVPSFSDADADGYAYGGGALSFNPAANSLFIAGFQPSAKLGEISIPPLGGIAVSLQAPVDPTGGLLASINPDDPSAKLIGGSLVDNGQLIVSAYSYYDGNGTQLLSHFVRPLALSTGPVVGPLRVGVLGAGYYSGYMGHVPAEWQTALGGPALTGQADIPVTWRTSLGPAAFAFDPEHINPSGAQPLVYYPIGHPTLGVFSQANPLYGGDDLMKGVVFPSGTSSVLFFGRHATTFCYGPGTDDPNLHGQLSWNGVDPWCYDPGNDAKGSHGYPYVPQVWAYDANDLAAVHAGTKQPWDVKPYAVWTVPHMGSEIGGAAYDPGTNRIYISEKVGDGALPRIHVFTVR